MPYTGSETGKGAFVLKCLGIACRLSDVLRK